MRYIIKKHVLSLTMLFAAVALSACGNDGQSRPQSQGSVDSGTYFNEAKTQGQATLRVLYVPAAGFAYEDESGELTGVSVAIMEDFKSWFERYHGVRLQLDFVAETDWSEMYQRVTNAEGGVFGLGNVTITEQRREQLAFSPAYLHNVAVLVTPDDIAPINGQEDLAEKLQDLQPLAFAGTLHEVRVRELRDQVHAGAALQRVETNQAVLDHVVDGHYSYIDAYNYHRAVEQGMPIRHHPAFSLHGERFGIIMPHDNDWQSLLTAFFAAEGGYLQTERYAQILQQHLGEQVATILLKVQ